MLSPRPSPPSGPAARALAQGLGLALWVVVIAAGFTPLVMNPHGWDDAYFGPKWIWMAGLGVIGAAATGGRALLGRPATFPLSPVWLTAVAYAIWNFASLLWARSPSLAFERALQIGALTLWLGAALQVVRTRRALIGLAWLGIAVASITALWTLEQDFIAAFHPEWATITPNLPDWRGFLSAGLGNTNHIGDLLALALLPALVMLAEARRRAAVVALLAACVALAAGLTVCWSVGSSAGLVLGALAMLALALRREGARFFLRRPGRWVALAALWGAMLAFYFVDQPLNPHRPGLWRQAFGSERWREGGPTRLVIWAGGLEIVRSHPWLGAGAGNFIYVYPETDSKLIQGDPELEKYRGLYTNAAHNVALQAWSELGIVGLFLLAALALLALRGQLDGIRWRPRAEWLARLPIVGLLVAWFAHGMMNFSLEQPTGAVSLYFILLAALVEERARRLEVALPALAIEKGRARLRVEFRTMSEPIAAGVSFVLGSGAAVGGALAMLALGLAALWPLHRPFAAQAEYARAREFFAPLGPQGSPTGPLLDAIKVHSARALALDPWATGCRSFYSEILTREGRGEEAMEQLRLLRRRLNSTELWDREARIWKLLGDEKKSRHAREEYERRMGMGVRE